MIEPGARIDMDDPSGDLRRASEQIMRIASVSGRHFPPSSHRILAPSSAPKIDKKHASNMLKAALMEWSAAIRVCNSEMRSLEYRMCGTHQPHPE
jgi:hypothetical protein